MKLVGCYDALEAQIVQQLFCSTAGHFTVPMRVLHGDLRDWKEVESWEAVQKMTLSSSRLTAPSSLTTLLQAFLADGKESTESHCQVFVSRSIWELRLLSRNL